MLLRQIIALALTLACCYGAAICFCKGGIFPVAVGCGDVFAAIACGDWLVSSLRRER